jgi:hypothetical protein
MRCLGTLSCGDCGRSFYGDLSAGHGLFYPVLLEADSGKVHTLHPPNWFSKFLEDSYAVRNQTSAALNFTDELFRHIKNPAILNCLDKLYGHSLMKLWNVQYYLDQRPELDVIVITPRFLRWMIPDGVAAIWTVDLPLRCGDEWNDWLNGEIKNRVNTFEHCILIPAIPEPTPTRYNIERFTGIQPFPITDWHTRLSRPTVTFIWREDRPWDHVGKRDLFKRARRKYKIPPHALDGQVKRVISLASTLQKRVPNLDFAVVGMGQTGKFPSWIADIRQQKINEQAERDWCQRYAESHIVIGVHGSNLLLPSAHAGATINLMPPQRWGNFAQDMTYTPKQTGQEIMFRYQFVPQSFSPEAVAQVAIDLLQYMPAHLLHYHQEWNDPEIVEIDPLRLYDFYRQIREYTQQFTDNLKS